MISTIRNTIISIKRLCKKVSSFLHKIDKKKERDQELLRYLEKIDKKELNKFKNDKQYMSAVGRFNDHYLGGYKGIYWNIVLSIVNGEKSVKYIPEDIMINHIIPRLNNVAHMAAFEDKGNFDSLFYDLKKPQTYLRYLDGKYFDAENNYLTKVQAQKIIESLNRKVLVKPSWKGSGRGKGVKSFQSENSYKLFQYLESKNNFSFSERAYLVQEYIVQHELISKIYPHSLNTIRIMTCRVNGEVKHLNSRLRIGKNGSIIDQGYFIGIKENGTLKENAIDFNLEKHKKHKETGFKFSNFKIPSFKRAVQFCKDAHKRLLRFDIVAWDIAIDKAGDPVFIEMNLSAPDIAFIQMANGPLFGQYTEEILEEMEINLHFNI